jgi:hypothetical protein
MMLEFTEIHLNSIRSDFFLQRVLRRSQIPEKSALGLEEGRRYFGTIWWSETLY